MLDSMLRPIIDPSLNKAADRVTAYNIPANIITLAAFAIGLIGCFALAIQAYLPALLLVAANLALNGMAGALALQKGKTDFGAYLHIVCPAIFYTAFIFFFVLGHPAHILAGAFLLFSYVALFVTHLVHGLIAAQRGGAQDSLEEGGASFHAASLVEKAEIIIFMVLVCLMPGQFIFLVFLFGILCWVTAVGRSFEAWRGLAPIEQNFDEAENIR